MKKTLALLIAICLLLSLYLYLEEPSTGTKFKPYYRLANKITIIKEGNAIRLEKNETWKIIEPAVAELEPSYLNSLQKLLDNIEPEAVINNADPRQGIYGLIPPELVLIVEGKFGREVFSFGKYADFASARYLQKENDSKIYLVKEELFKVLNANLNTIRAKKPIKFDLKQLQSIAAIRKNLPSLVIRKSLDSWVLESSNISFEVDEKIFKLAVDKLSKLEALNFFEEIELRPYGLDNPDLTLRILLNDKNGSRVIDVIFAKGDNTNPFYFMKELGSLSIFQVLRRSYSDWLKELDYFRSRRLFTKIEDPSYTEEQIKKLLSINALGVMELSAFVPSDQKIILKIGEISLEVGQNVPSALEQDEQAPSFVKINSENHQYVLILSADDIEFLKSLSSNVE